MFNLKDFIKKGLLDAVGKMADYQVILNATGWHEKGVLFEDDLAEINIKIDDQYKMKETIHNEIIDEIVTIPINETADEISENIVNKNLNESALEESSIKE